jgi:hypothetical protein
MTPYQSGQRAALEKLAVFQEWEALRPAKPSVSVGGGGPVGANIDARQDFIQNLRRKLRKAPQTAARLEADFLRNTAPLAGLPGRYTLGRRPNTEMDAATSPVPASNTRFKYKQPVGVQQTLPARPEVHLSHADMPALAHEVGHFLDPAIRSDDVAQYDVSHAAQLPFERRASREAIRRAGNDPAVAEDLYRAYGTYLQGVHPLPESIQKEMYATKPPLRERAWGMYTRLAADPSVATTYHARAAAMQPYDLANVSNYQALQQHIEAGLKPRMDQAKADGLTYHQQQKLKAAVTEELKQSFVPPHDETVLQGLLDQADQQMSKTIPAQDLAKLRAYDQLVHTINTNPAYAQTVEQQMTNLANLPAHVQPDFDKWLERKRMLLDRAFGAGAGDAALKPILDHLASLKRP